jgi:hypothetical protein
VALTSGGYVGLAKATPEFSLWTGPAPADAYVATGKPVIELGGEPLFAELAILRTLHADGWDGVWVDTLRDQFLTGMGQTANVPTDQLALLDRIHARTGDRSGCFDVFAWKDDRVLFVEAKRARRDRFRASQTRWLSAALEEGLPLDSFLIVEWSAGSEPVWAESEEEASIETFDDARNPAAHEAFVAWVTANPDGYVLNPGAARGPMIHLAKCSHLTWANCKASRLTASEKLCCTDRLALEQHWRSATQRDPVVCGDCL